jgi:hypothetical protein
MKIDCGTMSLTGDTPRRRQTEDTDCAYKAKVVDLFRSGRATEAQWEQMAQAVLYSQGFMGDIDAAIGSPATSGDDICNCAGDATEGTGICYDCGLTRTER